MKSSNKKFVDFSSLWNYCIYCPFCKKDNREAELNLLISPNKISNKTSILNKKEIKLFKFSEQSKFLEIDLNIKNVYNASLDNFYKISINGFNNSFTISSKDNSIIDPKLLLYISGSCKECLTYISMNSILNTKTKVISGISAECEILYLLHSIDKYFLFIDYRMNVINISKAFLNSQNNIYSSGYKYEIPIFDFHSLTQDEITKKIKNILTFI